MDTTLIGQLIAAGIAALVIMLLWAVLNTTGRTIMVALAVIGLIAYSVSVAS